MIAGTTVVLHRRFEAEAVARALRAGAVTLVSLVPTALVRLLDVLDGPPPPALRCVLVGGAAAPPALLAAARERGLPVAPTYGLTEAASQVATAAPDDPPDEAGAVGTPLLPTEVRVRAAPWKAGELAAPWTAGEVATTWKAGDLAAPGKACELAAGGEEGERGASGEGPVLAQPGEEGEILVRGPSVSPGYLAADGWITPVTVDGWLATGDLGHLRADGVLVVSGRCDDLIITGGENVAPAEVEAALLRHPAVAEAAVAGVPDAEWGQAVVAWVVPRPGTRPTLEELRAACRVALAPHKLPRRLVLVGALPRTAAGKVRRAVLRAPGESVSRVR